VCRGVDTVGRGGDYMKEGGGKSFGWWGYKGEKGGLATFAYIA
jgi:hypothetical protein